MPRPARAGQDRFHIIPVNAKALDQLGAGYGAAAITASAPSEKGPLFDPAESKVYRHPTFYDIPDDVPHI